MCASCWSAVNPEHGQRFLSRTQFARRRGMQRPIQPEWVETKALTAIRRRLSDSTSRVPGCRQTDTYFLPQLTMASFSTTESTENTEGAIQGSVQTEGKPTLSRFFQSGSVTSVYSVVKEHTSIDGLGDGGYQCRSTLSRRPVTTCARVASSMAVVCRLSSTTADARPISSRRR